MVLLLLMIDNRNYPGSPPSEIRQDQTGLAEERRRNGVIGVEPLFHINFEKMEEKSGVTLNRIHNPVHCVMVMIKRPAPIRVHAMVNPMTFFFTVKVV
jgi:hypothetical protein